MHGATRFADTGRGQGIQHIRKQVRKWDGIFSIRSGTARMSELPEWDDSAERVEGLAAFPGAHIGIILPAVAAKAEAEAASTSARPGTLFAQASRKGGGA